MISKVEDLPSIKTALLLGTSKYLSWGVENLNYKYRIEKAIELWKSEKVSFILISGDNSNKNYNEPKMMKEDLIDAGIPNDAIYLDYAGFRTFDSVHRAKEIFNQDSLIIISQEFHAKRANFIACEKDIYSVILPAKNPNMSLKTRLREYPARLLMFLDLYVIGTQPKFSGEKIIIGANNPQF